MGGVGWQVAQRLGVQDGDGEDISMSSPQARGSDRCPCRHRILNMIQGDYLCKRLTGCAHAVALSQSRDNKESNLFDTSFLFNPQGTGTVNKDLSAFLELNLSKPKGDSSIVLGVSESILANAIKSTPGLKCGTSESTAELIRGIRFHASKLLK